MKPEYRKGPEIREEFERTMAALFQVKKSELKEKRKPALKKKASKD